MRPVSLVPTPESDKQDVSAPLPDMVGSQERPVAPVVVSSFQWRRQYKGAWCEAVGQHSASKTQDGGLRIPRTAFSRISESSRGPLGGDKVYLFSGVV